MAPSLRVTPPPLFVGCPITINGKGVSLGVLVAIMPKIK